MPTLILVYKRHWTTLWRCGTYHGSRSRVGGALLVVGLVEVVVWGRVVGVGLVVGMEGVIDLGGMGVVG